LEGVTTKADTEFYMGKRIAYVYRVSKKSVAKGNRKASKIRVIWGKVTRPHGSTGTVRASFRHNLPPKAMGASVRVVRNKCFFVFYRYVLLRHQDQEREYSKRTKSNGE